MFEKIGKILSVYNLVITTLAILLVILTAIAAVITREGSLLKYLMGTVAGLVIASNWKQLLAVIRTKR